MRTRRNLEHWRQGDVVSRGETVGRVIQLHRRIDGRPFFMVAIEGEKNQFPDGWTLGTGPIWARCLECGQEYRTSDPTDTEFCPACRRALGFDVQARDAESRHQTHTRLRGNATPTKTAAVSSSPKSDDDDFETPFS
jgi:hypothetical protein